MWQVQYSNKERSVVWECLLAHFFLIRAMFFWSRVKAWCVSSTPYCFFLDDVKREDLLSDSIRDRNEGFVNEIVLAILTPFPGIEAKNVRSISTGNTLWRMVMHAGASIHSIGILTDTEMEWMTFFRGKRGVELFEVCSGVSVCPIRECNRYKM